MRAWQQQRGLQSDTELETPSVEIARAINSTSLYWHSSTDEQSTGGLSSFRWLVCHLSHKGEIVCNFGHQLFVFLLYHVEEFVQMVALNHINGESLESECSHLFAALMVGQVL